MPRCKDCTHYWSKSFPEMPWNYECKFGHSTPDYGDTESCSDFKEQYTIFDSADWSNPWDRNSDENYENNESENIKSKEEESYSYSSNTCYDSYSSYSGNESICAKFFNFTFLLFFGIISFYISFNVYSCQKKEEAARHARIAKEERLENLKNKSRIPTKQLSKFTLISYYGQNTDVIIDDVSVKSNFYKKSKSDNDIEVYPFGLMANHYVLYDEREKMYAVVVEFCHPAAITYPKIGYSKNKKYADGINREIFNARKKWKQLHEETLKNVCFRWE
ncbi:hypothetical protein [Candidatus Electronema sp. JM]|uniref:hypothetical protein n=1 Tax=Candidatus Electronema sp. JM TaxID=3401571 RepID=UPI003AA930BB